MFSLEFLATFLTVGYPVGVVIIRLPFLGILFLKTDGPEVVTEPESFSQPPLKVAHPKVLLVNGKGEPEDDGDDADDCYDFHITPFCSL